MVILDKADMATKSLSMTTFCPQDTFWSLWCSMISGSRVRPPSIALPSVVISTSFYRSRIHPPSIALPSIVIRPSIRCWSCVRPPSIQFVHVQRRHLRAHQSTVNGASGVNGASVRRWPCIHLSLTARTSAVDSSSVHRQWRVRMSLIRPSTLLNDEKKCSIKWDQHFSS